MSDKNPTVADVVRHAQKRRFFIVGWCLGNCDQLMQRATPSVEDFSNVVRQLRGDDRDRAELACGYRAGQNMTMHALMAGIDWCHDNEEFRVGDRVQWMDSRQEMRAGVVVQGSKPGRYRNTEVAGSWPLVRVTSRAGVERDVYIDPVFVTRESCQG